MDIRGIFFDLYGTLLVYGDMSGAWPAWMDVLNDGFDAAGLHVERSRLVEACDGFFTRPEPVGGADRLTPYERRLQALATELGAAVTRRDLSHIATRTAAAWQRFVTLDPRALPVLESLETRFPLALVSNYDHPPHVHDLLVSEGLAPFFDVVVISGDVGVKKPDPGIFSLPLQRLGLAPEHVAYVGDAPEDVQGAAAAGLVPILLHRGSGDSWAEAADYSATLMISHREISARPAAIVSSLDEVAELVSPGLGSISRGKML